MDLEKAKSYERLDHPGGEAQVDFCTIKVSKDSVLEDYKLLVMSFPYSNAAFVHPVPSENQECFLAGLKTLFHKAGGVPIRIWFDNLSAAVAGIEMNGERKLRELFTRFNAITALRQYSAIRAVAFEAVSGLLPAMYRRFLCMDPSQVQPDFSCLS